MESPLSSQSCAELGSSKDPTGECIVINENTDGWLSAIPGPTSTAVKSATNNGPEKVGRQSRRAARKRAKTSATQLPSARGLRNMVNICNLNASLQYLAAVGELGRRSQYIYFYIGFIIFILLSYLIFDFVCLTLSLADTHGIAKCARTHIRDAHTHAHTHTKRKKSRKIIKK